MVLSKRGSRRIVASLHVLYDSRQSTCTFHAQCFGGIFCPLKFYHCQDGAVQYSTSITKNGVEALGFESLCLLNNF